MSRRLPQLGVNQVRVLAWLALDGGVHHPVDVVRWSGAGPTQGFHALGLLVAGGWVERAGDRLEPEVRITPAGIGWLRRYPRGLLVFTRHSVRCDGRSLNGCNALGEDVLEAHNSPLGDRTPGGAWPSAAGNPPACQREALAGASGHQGTP